MENKKMVLLGMSGGVDSTAAARLLQKQGYEVVGATLRLQDEETEAAGNALQDIADAQSAAKSLGIRHMVLDRRNEFRRNVMDYFSNEYSRGATPNPCVICNRTVKFSSLIEAADREGIEYIATGHYANTGFDRQRGYWRLSRSSCLPKDQSYALYGLDRSWLGRILFPLGGFDKSQTRQIAAEAGLEISRKADSQDICFVPDGDYGAFLNRYMGEPGEPGDFIDLQGNILGRHRGIRYYTIGQRKGLGISLGYPAFVVCIDGETRNITLSDGEGVLSHELFAQRINWLDAVGREPIEVLAKIRYAHNPQPAVVYPLADGGAKVVFKQEQRAITPGQAVVFYDGDFVAGGGIIMKEQK